jgi:putative ABC transport system permease protein
VLKRLLSEVRYRLRAIFRRGALERDLDDELRFHLEQEAAKYVREGMAPREAMRQARLALGGVERTREDDRDTRGVSWLDVAGRDLGYALRGLRRTPGFTAAVVITLALGIGANTAMFGIADRLMFRAPPYLRDPGRVHRVYLRVTVRGQERVDGSFEYTRYRDLARWTTAFEETAAFASRELAVGTGEDAREVTVEAVSASFFSFFDARPALGRYFGAAEDSVPGGAPVVVLSWAFWQARYGGRPDVLGSPLQIGPAVYTVIGVAPEAFVGVGDEEPPVAFIPITTYAAAFRRHDRNPSGWYTNYNWGWLRMLVRRKPGVGTAAADADLSYAYQKSYAAERAMGPGMTPPEIARPRASAGPVRQERGPQAGREASMVLWVGGVALIVLLIACANVANLLLARALRRRRETAVRLALGVSRGRLLAQLLTEGVVLAALGGLAGLFVAWWGGAMLRSLFLPSWAPRAGLADPRTVAFAAIGALLVGVLTGLAPALHAGRGDLTEMLKAGAREGVHQRSRTRTALLLVQAALSVVLLVGAGWFVLSLQHVRSLRLGYDVDPVLYVERNTRGMVLTDAERITNAEQLLAKARSLPGVVNASLGLTVPFWDTWAEPLFVSGIDSVSRLGSFTLQSGSPEYFATIGTHILRGRGFTAGDRADAPRVVVVSEAMAQRLWPGRNAIGECIRIGADTMPCTTVVGIAENIKQNSLTDDSGLHYYLPIAQFHPQDAFLFVRTRGPAAASAEMVRRNLQRLMPGASYVIVTPMRTILAPQERAWQFGASMFLSLGVLALVLAAIGLYSVIGYHVAQRTHELGVRIALGAGTGNVLALVVGEGVRFAAAGILIGGAIALAAGRWVRPLLFEVSPRDPLVFGGVAAALLAVAVVASAIPAVRAARVDPTIALRVE